MDDEIQSLKRNKTWDLVPRPLHTNTVCAKWVFRTKYKSDGTIERLKARLIAQGFTQVPGLDFNHTFSPVIKSANVCIVLALVVMRKWTLRQLDVKNAFLNGSLDETVYMEQLPCYIDAQHPTHVCCLKKALYGLKQAPRAWFQRLGSFLTSISFKNSHSDTSLFIYSQGTSLNYLLIYVDDIIVTGNNDCLMQRLIDRVHKTFAIKDLGRLGYFIG